MTTYYVGKGGLDANNGTTWALRKLTLGGAEALSLSAGDVVVVGPGTYRESVTLDDSGSAGNPIVYQGDPAGKYTDGVGGVVRLSASDNDIVGARSQVILMGSSITNRLFRNFQFDGNDAFGDFIAVNNGDFLTVEDCTFLQLEADLNAIHFSGSAAGRTYVIRRCYFYGYDGNGIRLHASTENSLNANTLIENCFFHRIWLLHYRTYNFTIKNCTFLGVGIFTQLVTSSNLSYAYNNLFINAGWGGTAGNLEDYFTEDYGVWQGDPDERESTIGANSQDRSIHIMPPIIPYNNGFKLTSPAAIPFLAPWNTIYTLPCGQSPPTDDLFGITRPTADAKKTRGAVQFFNPEKETTTVYSTSPASIKFVDAMAFQMLIPITGKKMRVSVRVYREADYTGTNPSIAIKQYGREPINLIDTGSSATWNLLQVDFKPDALPPYVMLEIRSDNTASSGNYDVFFDDLQAR